MRILVATWTCRQVGGTETYLARVTALLTARGHNVAFAFEVDEPQDRPRLTLPESVTLFRIARAEGTAGMNAAREWHADVVYAHGLLDPVVEEQLLELAPAVFFAHSYYGTCISGDKTHKLPVIQPCARKFGPACLALYYPRRCGGLNPATMATDYARQRQRQSLLGRYGAVVTHSAHMRGEFERHGAARGRVFSIPFVTPGADSVSVAQKPRAADDRDRPWRLTFIGRMDRLKGGDHLLDALPRVYAQLKRPVHLTLAGDGPDRSRWERHAEAATSRASSGVRVEFAGWLQRAQLTSLLDTSDLLAMPSLWPEPYGLVGAEANFRGVPVVAYATGGIPEWLVEGQNGCLAPADPPTVEGLADAMIRCLGHLAGSDSLRERSRMRAALHPDDDHVDALLEILRQVAAGATGPTVNP
jgi:glycosyltransferase involved in cell wall biosynthesis